MLDRVARRYGATRQQVALCWLISKSPVIAIPKALALQHVRENAAAADLVLQDTDLQEIERVTVGESAVIPVDMIRVVPATDDGRALYRTLAAARANRLGMIPSPEDLAAELKAGAEFKPVRVVRAANGGGEGYFDLIEGRSRFWAWVIAYGEGRPVPALVRYQVGGTTEW